MKPGSDGQKLSTLERFEAENERILRDAQQADREARAKVADYEKKLAQARARREKAREQFDRMRSDYEHIEAGAIEEDRRRIAASALKKEDLMAGKISAEAFFQQGQSQEAIDAAARKETDKRLGDLLSVVRAKSLELLRLEVEEAVCEKEVLFLKTYPANFMLERMRAQIKSLESLLIQNASYLPVWTAVDEKKAALNRATGIVADGRSWDNLDLEGVRRLKFEAEIPDEDLSTLKEIIAEMEARPGSKVSLVFTSISPHGKRGLSVQVWRGYEPKKSS